MAKSGRACDGQRHLPLDRQTDRHQRERGGRKSKSDKEIKRDRGRLREPLRKGVRESEREME